MQDASSKIYANNATLESKISTLSTNVTAQIGKAIGIGQPIIRLNDELNSDEIRLEGAEVSRDTYANLFAIYGTTYGAGDGVLTFNLPDFRNRAIWGADSFGYVEAGLPNHNHTITMNRTAKSGLDSATVWSYGENRYGSASITSSNASSSNSIYGKSNTVQPPAIKVRVVTRYK